MGYEQYSTVLCLTKGTRHAILRRQVERSMEKQIGGYVCFIYYCKAFDTVKHESLIQFSQSLDVDAQDNKLQANLYSNQQAAVRYNGEVGGNVINNMRYTDDTVIIAESEVELNNCWTS